jgi:hypothetical protein
MADADDDKPALRADTLAALHAFLAERDAAKAAEADEAKVTPGGPVALLLQEDWQVRPPGVGARAGVGGLPRALFWRRRELT